MLIFSDTSDLDNIDHDYGDCIDDDNDKEEEEEDDENDDEKHAMVDNMPGFY